MGCAIILTIIAVLAACMYVFSLLGVDHTNLPDGVARAFQMLIWIEAGLAMISFIGVHAKDPGIVQRSPSTCSPMPEEVARRLSEGIEICSLGNVWDGQKSFCMRCLVWRDPASDPVQDEGCRAASHDMCGFIHCGTGSRAHHCSTCERCVLNFDHHCQVLGVCIAGQGFSGNVLFYHSLVAMGISGPATLLTLVSLMPLYAMHDETPWIVIMLPLWFLVIIFICRRPLLQLVCCRGVRLPCRCPKRTPKAMVDNKASGKQQTQTGHETMSKISADDVAPACPETPVPLQVGQAACRGSRAV